MDGYLPDRWDEKSKQAIQQHTFLAVYCSMFIAICRFYPGLPDARTLTLDEIVFFYDGLRPYLKELTKPR